MRPRTSVLFAGHLVRIAAAAPARLPPRLRFTGFRPGWSGALRRVLLGRFLGSREHPHGIGVSWLEAVSYASRTEWCTEDGGKVEQEGDSEEVQGECAHVDEGRCGVERVANGLG